MVASTSNAEHYTWGNNCVGWHLLKNESLSVIEEKMPAGTSENLHYHNKAQQLFYILSGVALFEINGVETLVNANESIYIPPLTKHLIKNTSNSELRFLVISQPKSHGDRQEV